MICNGKRFVSIGELANLYSIYLADLVVTCSAMPMLEIAECSGGNTGDGKILYGGESRDGLLPQGVQVPYPYIHHGKIIKQLIIERILNKGGAGRYFQAVQRVARPYLQHRIRLVQNPALNNAFGNINLCPELFDAIDESGLLNTDIDLHAIAEQEAAPNSFQLIIVDSLPGRKVFP